MQERVDEKEKEPSLAVTILAEPLFAAQPLQYTFQTLKVVSTQPTITYFSSFSFFSFCDGDLVLSLLLPLPFVVCGASKEVIKYFLKYFESLSRYYHTRKQWRLKKSNQQLLMPPTILLLLVALASALSVECDHHHHYHHHPLASSNQRILISLGCLNRN